MPISILFNEFSQLLPFDLKHCPWVLSREYAPAMHTGAFFLDEFSFIYFFFFNCNTHTTENESHLTLSSFRSFSAGSSISGQGKKPGKGVKGLAFGLHAPEKAPMRLLMLRREEITCGGRHGSLSSSVSMFRASFSTETSTPLPLPALWNRWKCVVNY